MRNGDINAAVQVRGFKRVWRNTAWGDFILLSVVFALFASM